MKKRLLLDILCIKTFYREWIQGVTGKINFLWGLLGLQ